MFRSFIYLDTEKLYTYKKQLDGKDKPKAKETTQKSAVEMTAAIGALGLKGSKETSVTSEYTQDNEFVYDLFEKALAKLDGEEYFDCVLNENYDISTVLPMNIVRISSYFNIPETFDYITFFQTYKSFLIKQANSSQQEAAAIMDSAKADIPIIAENDNITIAGKLNTKYLCENYESLEDYEDQEVFILCKINSLVKKEKVEIFDPLKDFIHFPRAVRRKADNKLAETGLEKIIIDGPVLKVEIIAIYK